ncbi:GGDEF domain-containing protein [Marinomonas sp. 2405UD68-3]|uniref:GGDEF domain-containing protein n=1 Tax=Marinomonas sp. 2405UD68-3 TaxID=3391835 RepID=UPI0039C978F8
MKVFIKPVVKRLYSGKETDLTGADHQRFLAGLFSATGSLLSFVFCVNALISLEIYIAMALFIVSLFLCFSYLVIHSKKYAHFYALILHISISGLLSLGVLLVYTGGLNNSGPLWIFIIPPIAMAFCGLKLGIIYNAVFSIVIGIMLFYPEDVLLATSYSYEFKSRLMYSFLTALTLSTCYEAARYKSYRQLQRLTEKYKLESKEDELTGLPNRRGMWNKLKYEYDTSMLRSTRMTIVLCDIDHFKSVNDTYGHGVGDNVLKHVSTLAQKSLSRKDILSRWGGEEFLLMIPGKSEKNAVKTVENLCAIVEKNPYIHMNEKINITMSAGLCEISSDIDVKDAITLSDKCLYQAKRTGRNKVIANSQFTV